MHAMVSHPDYPCLGARSVVRRDRATFRVYDELGTRESAEVADLHRFASGVDLGDGLASFVALFRGPVIEEEQRFEDLLWAQLREVHAADEHPWTSEVWDDPNDPHFAFSATGNTYFVVGLHCLQSTGPGPSRPGPCMSTHRPRWPGTASSCAPR
jgi:uncharacterized protein